MRGLTVFLVLAAALAAWNAGRGDWQAAGGVAVVYLAVRAGVALHARRRARARSWLGEPVLVGAFVGRLMVSPDGITNWHEPKTHDPDELEFGWFD